MTPVNRVVAVAVLLGIGAQVSVSVLLGGAGAVTPGIALLTDVPAPLLVVGMLLLTVAGDLLSVPVRRGEHAEAMTLLEAAAVIGVLLLPARDALWIPVAAIALTSVLARRPLVKSVFNVGNHGAASAVLVLVVHTVAGQGAGLVWQTVLALVLGLLGFFAVNLGLLSRVLTVLGDADAPQVLTDGARLAVVNLTATVAIAGGSVVAADAAPALLPFSLVPAVALLYAYRAAAQSSEHRRRSTSLLALSHVLAGRVDRDEMLPAFLSQCRQAFGADLALAVLPHSAAPEHADGLTLLDDAAAGATTRSPSASDLALLRRLDREGGPLAGPLPDGWSGAVSAPLEADGQPLGTLVLATRDRSRTLGSEEVALLVPLASALAVALRGAAHLRRLTEATSKLQAVVDQSSDGILVLDGAGVVQLWSPALHALTGTGEASASGRPLSTLVHALGADGTPCDAFEAGRALLTPATPQATVELTLLRDDGDSRVVRCAHAGVFDGEALVRDVVIVHDVTRERQVERLKADFIATVSHELRTPITPIKGYADLLRRRGDSMTPQRRDECLAVIGDRCDHLARLVEDLLLASRISATEGGSPAQVAMAKDDLVTLARRAAGDFGDDGERVRLALPEDPVPVQCDPVRVTQVLTNLIGNALKYSEPGTPVDVALRVDGEQALVTVQDRGRGIPADQLERVFEKFHRLEDPLRMSTGGTGLGLYIARHLATAMGGSLHCTSTLGVGSTFSFTLLRAGVGTAASAAPTTARDALPSPRTGGGPDAPTPRRSQTVPSALR